MCVCVCVYKFLGWMALACSTFFLNPSQAIVSSECLCCSLSRTTRSSSFYKHNHRTEFMARNTVYENDSLGSAMPCLYYATRTSLPIRSWLGYAYTRENIPSAIAGDRALHDVRASMLALYTLRVAILS